MRARRHQPDIMGYTRCVMSQSRKPEEPGEKVGEEKPVAPVEHKSSGKTLQELERLQFDALDRAGFDR
jgi:hypothetical protein